MDKISKRRDGYGVYYSFCSFDDFRMLCGKFAQEQVVKIQGSGDADLLSAVSHVATVARRGAA